jgi:hypothetical protein
MAGEARGHEDTDRPLLPLYFLACVCYDAEHQSERTL